MDEQLSVGRRWTRAGANCPFQQSLHDELNRVRGERIVDKIEIDYLEMLDDAPEQLLLVAESPVEAGPCNAHRLGPIVETRPGISFIPEFPLPLIGRSYCRERMFYNV